MEIVVEYLHLASNQIYSYPAEISDVYFAAFQQADVSQLQDLGFTFVRNNVPLPEQPPV